MSNVVVLVKLHGGLGTFPNGIALDADFVNLANLGQLCILLGRPGHTWYGGRGSLTFDAGSRSGLIKGIQRVINIGRGRRNAWCNCVYGIVCIITAWNLLL